MNSRLNLTTTMVFKPAWGIVLKTDRPKQISVKRTRVNSMTLVRTSATGRLANVFYLEIISKTRRILIRL